MELENVHVDQIVMKLIMNYFWANQDGHLSNTQYDFMFQKGPIVYFIDDRSISANTEGLHLESALMDHFLEENALLWIWYVNAPSQYLNRVIP